VDDHSGQQDDGDDSQFVKEKNHVRQILFALAVIGMICFDERRWLRQTCMVKAPTCPIDSFFGMAQWTVQTWLHSTRGLALVVKTA
jgi:hypothetical protein